MAGAVFLAKQLIDGTGAGPVRDPYVIVEKGRIAQIGSGRLPQGLAEGYERIDLPEATIIPGLVDAHVHLALALHRPDWHAIKNNPTRLALLAAEGARETLRAGVTTIGDCGARHDVTMHVRDAIAEGALPGSRLWACGTSLTVTNGHLYFWTEWGLDSAEELRKGVRQMVWAGADFIKIMASGGTTHGAKTNRRRAQYSADELRAAVDDAHRLNRRVHCHVNATEAMRNCIEAGVDVLEHCNWLGPEVGTIDYNEDLARLGAKKGIYAGVNGGRVFQPLSARDGRAQDWGELVGWDLMRRMEEDGMRIFINSDAIGRGFDAFPELMRRMVAEGMVRAAEIIEMSTLIPAQAMGLDDRIGSLEKGKMADMVFLPGDPLVDMSAIVTPLVVVKEGRIVVRDGQVIC